MIETAGYTQGNSYTSSKQKEETDSGIALGQATAPSSMPYYGSVSSGGGMLAEMMDGLSEPLKQIYNLDDDALQLKSATPASQPETHRIAEAEGLKLIQEGKSAFFDSLAEPEQRSPDKLPEPLFDLSKTSFPPRLRLVSPEADAVNIEQSYPKLSGERSSGPGTMIDPVFGASMPSIEVVVKSTDPYPFELLASQSGLVQLASAA